MSFQSKRLVILISGIATIAIGFLSVAVSKGPIADAGAFTIYYYDQAYLITGITFLIVGVLLLILVAYQGGKVRFGKKLSPDRN